MASKLPLGYTAAFPPSDTQILETGRPVIEESAPNYADMLKMNDMYDATIKERLDVDGSGEDDHEVDDDHHELVEGSKGKGKVDGTDLRVTRSQKKTKVLEVKGLRSRTTHNRLVKARGKERVTSADDETEDDTECDNSDNSEFTEDDTENDTEDASSDGSGEDDHEVDDDDHEVVERSKGKGKVDGTDFRVTRSQMKKKVLEVKGLRSRTTHNRLVKARGRERVTSAVDETEDDTECDNSDNSEFTEDDTENDTEDASSDGSGDDDHEVVERSKGKGKVDGTDFRVTRSQMKKKVLEVKGLRSRTTHNRLVKARGRERVTSADDETEDDTECDNSNNSEFTVDDTENDTEDASSDNSESAAGKSEKDSDNNSHDVSDLGEDELDYVDSVQGCVFCTVCNPPTEAKS